ncbi:MAG: hypothetical protein IKK99_00520 [Oscillospiraceae bacterium]|nr:hypothetical protein [Oscillospiraceae bacterium]
MEHDKHYPYWLAGMSAIAGVLVVFGISNLTGITLSDNVVRTLGTIEMIGIVTVGYTTVKLKAVKNSGRYTSKHKKKK